jgi:hypothetical protein
MRWSCDFTDGLVNKLASFDSIFLDCSVEVLVLNHTILLVAADKLKCLFKPLHGNFSWNQAKLHVTEEVHKVLLSHLHVLTAWEDLVQI